MIKIFFALCLGVQAAPASGQFSDSHASPVQAVLPEKTPAPEAAVEVKISSAPAKPELAGPKARVLANKARVQTELKKYKEAAALWTDLLKLQPSYYPAYAERAYALRMDGEKKKAAADFEAAFAADPEQPRAYLLRGAAACAGGDFDLAAADLAKALELDPGLKRSVLYGKTRDFVRFKKKCK